MSEKNMKFKEQASNWLSLKEREVKKTTAYRYREIIENHLVPQFGDKNILEINNEEITNYMRILHVDYKYHTIENSFNVLRSILVYGGRMDVIQWRDLKFKKERQVIDVLSEKECKAINKALKESRDLRDLGILLALNTGARIGEICGIKWEDISLNKRSILIKHTVQRVPANDGSRTKTRVELLTPKSGNSIREIAIPEFLYKILCKLEKSIVDEQSFLLSSRANRLIEPRSLERHFEKRCNEIIGRRVKFHNLRHTYASLSMSNGVDAKIVSEMLGHGNVVTTLKFYRNVGFSDKFKGVRALEGVIGV